MIRFVLADLRRLAAGALVIVLLVALATALGVAVTLQERALRLGSARAADRFDLVIGAAGSETQLVLSAIFLQAAPLPLVPGRLLDDLSADPRVAWAAPVGFGDFALGLPIVGTTEPLVASAGPLTEGRSFADSGEAVVGAAVPLALGASVRPMHGLPEEGGQLHAGIVYRVVGRMPPTGTPWDRAILVPIEAVWHVHGMGDGHLQHKDADGDDHDGAEAEADHKHVAPFGIAPGVPAIIVKPKTIADAYRLRAEYRTGATLAVFPGEVLTRLYATLGDAKTVLSLVAIGAQALVAAAIGLVTIVHIGQRRRQIGALRAFGAPRLAIFGIVWGEIFLLVGGGVIAGFGLGYLAARLISARFTAANGVVLPVTFESADAGLALALLGLAALLAALPAALAYRHSPAAALRS